MGGLDLLARDTAGEVLLDDVRLTLFDADETIGDEDPISDLI